MRNFFIFVLAASPCCLPTSLSTQPCPKPDVQTALRKVKAQQADLLAYKLTDEMDEEVPVPLQGKIRAFKDSLTALADATLVCQPNAGPKVLESSLAKLLDANKPQVQEVYDPNKPPQLDHIYGSEMRVRVSAPTNPPHLLLIEFGFGIDCGYDSVLLAYEQHNGGFRRLIR